MSSNPLVSVFLPTYNQDKYIAEAIESALNQDYENLEIIIGDDFSTDGTWAIVQDYQRRFPEKIEIFRNPENLGITGNCNEVLKRCTGKYIAFHAGDDVWLPTKLSKQINTMEDDEKCLMSYHDLEVFNSDTNSIIYHWNTGKNRPSPIIGDSKFVLRKLVENTAGFMGALSVVVRRDALEKNAGYDSRLPHLSELSLWVQVLHGNDGNVKYIPELLARYRKHSNGITQKSHELEYDFFLSIIENEYPDLIGSVRRARARRYYSGGVRRVLSKEYNSATSFLVNSMRYGFVSSKILYWIFRSIFRL